MQPLSYLVAQGRYFESYKDEPYAITDNMRFTGTAKEKTERMKDFLIMQAVGKEKIDGQELAYLYNQLSDDNSPLSKLAACLANIKDAYERGNAICSKFIQDAFFGSARDGILHIDNHFVTEYAAAIRDDTVKKFHEKTLNKKPKPLPPNVSIFSDDQIKSHFKQPVKKFSTSLDSFNAALLPDLEKMLKDDENRKARLDQRVNKKAPKNATPEEKKQLAEQLDHRSESYKNYIDAIKEYKKALSDPKANVCVIGSKLQALSVAATAYQNDHKGLTKGMVGQGAARYKNSQNVKKFIDTYINKLDDLCKKTHGIGLLDKSKEKQPELTLGNLNKEEYIRRQMVELNNGYDEALKNTVLRNYNLSMAGKLNGGKFAPLPLDEDEIGHPTKDTILDIRKNYSLTPLKSKDQILLRLETLARAVALEQIAKESRTKLNTLIKGEGLDMKELSKLSPETVFKMGTSFDERLEKVKEDKTFQAMAHSAVNFPERFPKYLQLAKEGKLTEEMANVAKKLNHKPPVM